MQISIIVPIYNVENEIIRCLVSVIEQTHKNIELILVNDCTQDSSFEVARDYLKECFDQNKVKFIEHSENRGLSATRNSGIKSASGDYLFFLDSDDALSTPTALADLVSLTQNRQLDDYDVIIGNSQQISDGRVIAKGTQASKTLTSSLEIFKAYAEGKLSITAWGRLVKRSFLENNSLYFKEGIYHEDELWSYYLYRNAKSVIATDEVIYDYFEREGSISFNVKEKNVKDLNIVIAELYVQYLNTQGEIRNCLALKIEKLKRRSLKWVSQFDSKFIAEEINVLARINTGFDSRNIKFILQNVILKLPTKIVCQYLKKRWGRG